jgi:hypothetical protein
LANGGNAGAVGLVGLLVVAGGVVTGLVAVADGVVGGGVGSPAVASLLQARSTGEHRPVITAAMATRCIVSPFACRRSTAKVPFQAYLD